MTAYLTRNKIIMIAHFKTNSLMKFENMTVTLKLRFAGTWRHNIL
jgi:hypothetical protein